MATRTRRASTKAAAPVEDLDDIEEIETEEDEVEEAPKPARKAKAKKAAPVVEDDDEDEEPAPTKKATKAKTEDTGFSTAWLTEHVNETLGTEHKATAIRIVLRKLAKDGKLDRTVGETRGRYSFSGPKDPVVKAVVAAVKSGAIDEDRKEKLGALKTKAASAKGKKAKPAPVEDEDDVEELEDDE